MQLHGAQSGCGLAIRQQSVPQRSDSEYVIAGGACCLHCNGVWV